ncbi:uncharacterized protein [Rutidosis leptorrhynchoides]|uniref:uncharacterized protein n=1 Tax=Rutidosis leptorrhynchoides TaxID=125765 RepID=UPI003A98EA9C
MQTPEKLILDICNPDLRENALMQLSKNTRRYGDMAPWLWYSTGTVTALIQEIISIYPYLSPHKLTPDQSTRVSNAIVLLQCIATHQDTRKLLVKANIPIYLYPFLNTTSRLRTFEFLRICSLGVIGALVKVDDTEVINFLLSTEIFPMCRHTMETGSELSKKVALFIIKSILLNKEGLKYACSTAKRFCAVTNVLGNMVGELVEQPSKEVIKLIIGCYLNLSRNPRACDALKSCFPQMLQDGTFTNYIHDDPNAQKQLEHLLLLVQGARVKQGGGGY